MPQWTPPSMFPSPRFPHGCCFCNSHFLLLCGSPLKARNHICHTHLYYLPPYEAISSKRGCKKKKQQKKNTAPMKILVSLRTNLRLAKGFSTITLGNHLCWTQLLKKGCGQSCGMNEHGVVTLLLKGVCVGWSHCVTKVGLKLPNAGL